MRLKEEVLPGMIDWMKNGEGHFSSIGKIFHRLPKKPESETEITMELFTKNKLIEDLKVVVNDAEALLKRAASDSTKEWVANVQAKAKKSLTAANDWLAEEEGALTAKARATVQATEDYVQANTWKILGLAAMAGVCVGILAVRLGMSGEKAGKKRIPERLEGPNEEKNPWVAPPTSLAG